MNYRSRLPCFKHLLNHCGYILWRQEEKEKSLSVQDVLVETIKLLIATATEKLMVKPSEQQTVKLAA